MLLSIDFLDDNNVSLLVAMSTRLCSSLYPVGYMCNYYSFVLFIVMTHLLVSKSNVSVILSGLNRRKIYLWGTMILFIYLAWNYNYKFM